MAKTASELGTSLGQGSLGSLLGQVILGISQVTKRHQGIKNHEEVIKRHQGTKMHQQALKCLGHLGLKGAFR